MSCRTAYCRIKWKIENLTRETFETDKNVRSESFAMKFNGEELKW
jgi:hypothetical protein